MLRQLAEGLAEAARHREELRVGTIPPPIVAVGARHPFTVTIFPLHGRLSAVPAIHKWMLPLRPGACWRL